MTVTINELQKLEPSAIIELFEIDLTPLGGALLRFHAGTNELSQDIVWNGNTYTRYPIDVEGFSQSSGGSLPRLSIKASNALGALSAFLLQYDDLIGAKFTRIRTLKKYLDTVNFIGGTNPTADPSMKFDDDIFYIERKVNESYDIIEFEAVSSVDLAGLKLPRRQIIQNTCPFKYRSADCGYTGTDYFDRNDLPVGSSVFDVCGKKLSSCKKRFGENAELPFGGFPGAGLISG